MSFIIEEDGGEEMRELDAIERMLGLDEEEEATFSASTCTRKRPERVSTYHPPSENIDVKELLRKLSLTPEAHNRFLRDKGMRKKTTFNAYSTTKVQRGRRCDHVGIENIDEPMTYAIELPKYINY